jgi:hypothetical protein
MNSLNFCPCCYYHLCNHCLKNDRENILIHLKNIVQIYSNNIHSSLQINDLIHQADVILKNPQIIEFKDILLLFHQLNSYYQQMNTLPITIAKRTHENDDDENSSPTKQRRCESTDCLIEQDDDDIIFIETR